MAGPRLVAVAVLEALALTARSAGRRRPDHDCGGYLTTTGRGYLTTGWGRVRG